MGHRTQIFILRNIHKKQKDGSFNTASHNSVYHYQYGQGRVMLAEFMSLMLSNGLIGAKEYYNYELTNDFSTAVPFNLFDIMNKNVIDLVQLAKESQAVDEVDELFIDFEKHSFDLNQEADSDLLYDVMEHCDNNNGFMIIQLDVFMENENLSAKSNVSLQMVNKLTNVSKRIPYMSLQSFYQDTDNRSYINQEFMDMMDKTLNYFSVNVDFMMKKD